MAVFLTGTGTTPKTATDLNTLLLLHADSFKDSSIYGRNISNKSVTLDTTIKKFGESSFYFNGKNARIETDGTPYKFGTNKDFTIDLWCYPETLSIDNFFFNGGNNGDMFFGRVGGNSTVGHGRVQIAWDNTTTSKIVIGAWNHVALVRKGSQFDIYVNGNSDGMRLSSIDMNVTSALAYIGWQATSYYYKGYIDEFRISNVARWETNFIPPSEPYKG